jgi:hypothetical protein
MPGLFRALAPSVLSIEIFPASAACGAVALYAPFAVHRVRYFSIFREDQQ